MGTRINVLFDHELADYSNSESVLARLSSAIPAASAVRDYWATADPHYGHADLNTWHADPVSPCDSDLRRYTGPGRMFLTFTKRAAKIRTGGRWRGFLEIEPLRRVHLTAFRQIAAALGVSSFVMFADSCEVDDFFWGGRTLWECVELMERMWGPPQRSVEVIDERECFAAQSKWTYPFVWFLESNQLVETK
jgi:hypothetical protein